MAAAHELIVREYAETTAADPNAGTDIRAACARYLKDLEDFRWEFRTEMAEFCITSIESLFCHQQGEDFMGHPLRGKPFKLVPFQLFIVYNICGFFFPGTVIRRYQEGFLMLPRKNGKTPFATALCWTLGLWYSASYSKIKTVAGSMKQNMEGFGFLSYNLHRLGLTAVEDPEHGFRVLDSSLGHSFSGPVWDGQSRTVWSWTKRPWLPSSAFPASCWVWAPSTRRNITPSFPGRSCPSAGASSRN